MSPKKEPKDSEREEQIRSVTYLIRQQIAKQMDSVRARDCWTRILGRIPPDVVSEVLAQQLSSSRYQETPRCSCCRQY